MDSVSNMDVSMLRDSLMEAGAAERFEQEERDRLVRSTIFAYLSTNRRNHDCLLQLLCCSSEPT